MTTKKTRREWAELLKVIYYDIQCLNIDFNVDDNLYHYGLAIDNIKDLIKRLKDDI